MADKQILVTGSADAPAGYVVPNTVDLIPKAVSCILDGTGASGDFVPVLEVISDGGVVVAQSPGSTVTAGGSVEQSWFPRVGVTSQASSGSGLSWAYQASPAHITVSTASSGVVAPTTATGFFTNDTSLFAQGTAVVGGTTYYGIKVIGADGFYLTWASFSPYTVISSGVDYGIEIANGADPLEAGNYLGPIRRVVPSSDTTPDEQALNWISLGTQTGTPQTHAMVFQADNNNSVASLTALINVLCVCLDPNQSTYVG